jgi:hypothetical protein
MLTIVSVRYRRGLKDRGEWRPELVTKPGRKIGRKGGKKVVEKVQDVLRDEL